MPLATTDPITHHWTTQEWEATAGDPVWATAADIIERLALLDVAPIETPLVRTLGAATAEMALVSGMRWPLSADDPPVTLVRMIAKIARTNPGAGGPHTARLLDQLR